jgi:hypothetical protein
MLHKFNNNSKIIIGIIIGSILTKILNEFELITILEIGWVLLTLYSNSF